MARTFHGMDAHTVNNLKELVLSALKDGQLTIDEIARHYNQKRMTRYFAMAADELVKERRLIRRQSMYSLPSEFLLGAASRDETRTPAELLRNVSEPKPAQPCEGLRKGERIVTLEYRARCFACDGALPAGATAVWSFNGGTRHQECGRPPKPS